MVTPPLPKTVWAFIWHYISRHPWAISGFVFTALVWAIELSLSPYLMKVIIDRVVATGTDYSVLLQAVLWPALLYASMSLVINVTFRLYDYLNLQVSPAIKSSITNDMFQYLLRHSHGYFQNNFAGTLTKKIQDMVDSSEKIITIINESFYPQAFAMIIASVMLSSVVHPIIGVLLFVWTILFVGISYAGSLHAEKHAKHVSECFSKMSGLLSDSISNIMSTKLFYNLQYESDRIAYALKELVKADRKLLWFNLKVSFVQGLAVFILVGTLLYLLIQGVGKGWVTPGDFAMVLALTGWIVTVIWDIGKNMLDLYRAVGKCHQALTFIAEPHEIVDAENAPKLEVQKGEIVFDGVSHAYAGSKVIFNDLNIRIKPGERVGLVGYSGGGKSTFLKLILRLMDVKTGEITIDGQNISSVTKESLRRNIVTIPQESELFHRSILENIRFAKPDATDEEVASAAKNACCEDFIAQLPDGIHSLVGERGVKLSGGQKQRIAIARAFLKNAPILLLDEATSALDTATERLIQTSLHAIMQNKTTIVIAHRLSTLKDMDRILFFEEGVIIEQGSLDELLAKPGGKFAHLWAMQSEGFLSS